MSRSGPEQFNFGCMTTLFDERPQEFTIGFMTPFIDNSEHASDPRWRAVLARDRAWDGAVWYGVSSTKIYCRPSCPSRRPHPDRVTFFSSVHDASFAGYRACKRCAPDAVRTPSDAPHGDSAVVDDVFAAVVRTLTYLDSTEELVTLESLATVSGLSKAHLQRQFTRIVGCSPHEWHTARRAERLRTALRDGASVSHAAFAAGFESLPTAYAASAKHLGMAPGAYKRGAAGETLFFAVVPCVLGHALVAMTGRGVCRVILGDVPALLEQQFRDEFANATIVHDNAALGEVARSVIAIANGAVDVAPLPLDVRGTAFQQRVWRELTRIPRGETITYGELARRIGAPGAVRAVGTACGANPTALLVPCHRVLRGDGSMGGYRWGIARKEKLLAAERG